MPLPNKTKPVLELYYDGDWHDITASDDVYTRDPLAITRGRADEATVTPPATLSATIENRDGRYSTRLPTSALYGMIGRNQPCRLACRVLRDQFTRTETDGWGLVDETGETWQNGWSGGSGADFDVAAGVGTHLIGSANQLRISWLPDVELLDVDTAVTVSGLPANITGADVNVNLLLRMGSISGPYYQCTARITTAEAVQLEVWHSDGVATLLDSTTVAGLTHTGAAMRVRAQIEGPIIRVKAWLVAAGEPFDWQLTVQDDTLSAAGGVGIRSGVTTSNSNVPVTFAYEDFDVRLPRFHGEVESWPVRWNVKGSDVWAPITAYGIMRRLNAPGRKAKIASALTLAALALGPAAFWACDSGSDSTNAPSGLPGGAPLEPVEPGVEFGEDAPDLPGAAAVMSIGPTHHLQAPVDCPDTGSWTLSMWLQVDVDYVTSVTTLANLVPIRWITPGSAVYQWRISAFQTTTPSSSVGVFARNSSMAATSLNPGFGSTLDIMDGDWHYIAVRATQNGGNIDVEITVDDQTASESIAGTLTPPTEIVLGQEIEGDLSTSPEGNVAAIRYAALTVCASSDVTDLWEPGRGYPGETAAERLTRLSEQFGTPITIIGDPDTTALMGPQLAKAELDLYRDAADADGGILYEPRGAHGIAYRTHASLYNREARATIDYAAGDELAPDLDPAPDLTGVTNDVTVKRHGGGLAVVEQTTGPLNLNEPADDPQGIGRIPTEHTLILYQDSQCQITAAWLKHIGTWDEERYPLVPFDLTAMILAGKQALAYAVAALDVGDRLTITSPPAWLTYDPIAQLAQGFAEIIGSHSHTIAVNATPALPYEVAVVNDGANPSTNRPRIPAAAGETTLNEALDTTETGVDIISTTVRWIDSTNYAAQFPFDVMVGGEQMTVSVITGTTLTQTMTVTRSVNGVVKSHDAGTVVQLYQPAVAAKQGG